MNSRLIQLDGLRAMAFMLVFIHHAVKLPLGWMGVDIFFVISGFLITAILLRQKESARYYETFFIRRGLRILPPFFLFLAVVFTFNPGWSFAEWMPYLFFFSNLSDPMGMAGVHELRPLWSLSLEVQFYILWAPVVRYFSRAHLLRICLILLICAPVFRLLTGLLADSFLPVYHFLPGRLDLMAGGALLALRYEGEPLRFNLGRLRPLWLAAGCTLSFAFLAATNPQFRTSSNAVLFNTIGYSLVTGFAWSAVVLCLQAPQSSALFGFLQLPMVQYLGKISYAMYLAHVFFIRASAHVMAGKGPGWIAVSALILTLLWATLSWIVVEKPIQTFKNSKLSYLPAGWRAARQ